VWLVVATMPPAPPEQKSRFPALRIVNGRVQRVQWDAGIIADEREHRHNWHLVRRRE